jgi:bla regulator protein blaR1
MKNLTEIFSNPAFRALGWTLVHSVWQLLAIGSLYVVFIFFAKKASHRYNMGMGLLFAQVAIGIITFFVMQSASQAILPTETAVLESVPSFLQNLKVYFQNNISLIVSLWLLGSFVLFTRLVFAFIFVNKVKTNCQNTANEALENMLTTLKLKMGIEKPIEVKLSKVVNLPMMMGVLKPMILIPASLISGLTNSQLEMIIAHELAHIKRHDYLLNGIQSVIEVLYFFHPGMWLLSAQIRIERENCCDDMAIAACGNKVLLAKTLVQLQESIAVPQFALAFGKKQNPLLVRIQRIVGMSSGRTFTKESIWIVAGLCVTMYAFAQNTASKSKKKVEMSYTKGVKTLADTLKPNGKTSTYTIKNDEIDFQIKDDKIIVNGKQIVLSAEAQKQVNERIKLIDEQQELISKQSALIEIESEKMGEYSEKMTASSEPMQKLSKEMEQVSKKMEQVSKKYEKNASKKLSFEQLEKLNDQLEKEMDGYSEQMDKLSEQMDKLSQEMDKHSEPMDEISKKMDELSAPIDTYSDLIDKNMDEIINLLPKDVQSKLGVDGKGKHFPHPPKPPRPPRAPKGPRLAPPPPPPPPPAPPRPPKSPKNPKLAPPPPPPPPPAPRKN